MFGMFSSIGFKISAVFVVIICVLLGVGYFYYNSTQKHIQILSDQNARLELSVKMNEQVITRQREAMTRQSEENNRLNQALIDAEQDRNRLLNIFREHDLNDLAVNRPGLIENRINRATRDIFDQIERETEQWSSEQ